jgi:NAD-dependent SIR2 family protein deacetylase
MTTTALFLGAGASRAFGFPLTKDLLPTILKELESKDLFKGFSGGESAMQDLQRGLELLLPGLARSRDSLPLITDVLSLLDYSLSAPAALSPRTSLTGLAELRVLLERAIASALWQPENWRPPPTLATMASWLLQECRMPGQEIAVISTNYDTSIERAIFPQMGYDLVPSRVDFGFSWRDPNENPDVDRSIIYPRPALPELRLYKLHGSLNTLRCELCEHTYVNPRFDLTWLTFRKRRVSANQCHCGYGPLRSTLVAPSFIRDVRDVTLLETWRHALEFLRTADEWLIIGYSFPSEDIAIRSLFLRARNGRTTLPKLAVVQKGADPATEARYRLFFPDCAYSTGGLEDLLRRVQADPEWRAAFFRSGET